MLNLISELEAYREKAVRENPAYIASLKTLGLEEKLSEIRGIRIAKKSREREVQEYDDEIVILEADPEVAKYLVLRDRKTMDILEEIREKELDVPKGKKEKRRAVSYSDLDKKPGYDMNMVGVLYRLQSAGLISIDKGIKTTEDGRKAKYIKE